MNQPMKTVNLEKNSDMASTASAPTPEGKSYCPSLYLDDVDLRDMPVEGKAEITYRIKRITKELGEEGEDSAVLEIQDISYDPDKTEDSLAEEDSEEALENQDDSKEESDEEEKPKKVSIMVKKAKIDSSRNR